MCVSSFSYIGRFTLISFIDAFEMILCGATAVQIGTCHWTEGPKCFDRICRELKEIMESKNYKSIHDFKNKLKPWSKEGVTLSREAKMKNKGKKGVESTKSSPNTDNDYQMLSGLLMVLLAILLADKLNYIRL
jgi:dihydroorotate dehydrogenase (fumarate)